MEMLYQGGGGMCVTSPTGGRDVEDLVSLFEEIAEEAFWHPGDQIRAYAAHSAYFALQAEGRLIGGLQLVRAVSGATLPCLTVWPELARSVRAGAGDVALLALSRKFRGRSDLFWLLCTELWRYCAASGISELWFEVPPPVLRLYRRIGWPLQVAGPLRPHWGEGCYPCRMGVRELTEAMVSRAQASESYRQIVLRAYRDPAPGPLPALPERCAAP